MNAARVWIRDIFVIITCLVVLLFAWKAWQIYGAVKAGAATISREFSGATDFPTPDDSTSDVCQHPLAIDC